MKDGQISLNWTPPEDDGGAPITGYVLEYREEGQMKWKSISEEIPDAKHVKKGLQKDSLYEFRVAAVNKAGQGPFSEASQPCKATEPIGKYAFFFVFMFLFCDCNSTVS